MKEDRRQETGDRRMNSDDNSPSFELLTPVFCLLSSVFLHPSSLIPHPSSLLHWWGKFIEHFDNGFVKRLFIFLRVIAHSPRCSPSPDVFLVFDVPDIDYQLADGNLIDGGGRHSATSPTPAASPGARIDGIDLRLGSCCSVVKYYQVRIGGGLDLLQPLGRQLRLDALNDPLVHYRVFSMRV